jgi:hypothetical protein
MNEPPRAGWIVQGRPVNVVILASPGIVSLDRLTRLVRSSFRFGIVGGCRITDSTGLDFRWSLAPVGKPE